MYGDLHSTFMYPLSHVRRACFPFKERHLLLFAASVIAATNIAVETMWVDPRVRSICTELGTGRMRVGFHWEQSCYVDCIMPTSR